MCLMHSSATDAKKINSCGKWQLQEDKSERVREIEGGQQHRSRSEIPNTKAQKRHNGIDSKRQKLYLKIGWLFTLYT